MNTNAIRDISTRARRQLMEAVERRCLLYGIEEGAQKETDTVNGRVLSAAERVQRRELLRIQDDLRGGGKPGTGHAALVEQAAYTWFNRLFAIRFMEVNDRLPSHVRILSSQDGSFAPECLREAMDLPLDALDRAEAARLVAEGDDEELFRLILLAQCAELAECMPAVFERVGSAMELLLPDGLLAKDGVVESLVTGIPEGDWREGVEIVGWAYQFYVQERKDEFFKSKRKAGKDDIAPATQLFTPEYIVRFLVQNSLGRLWVLNNPNSPLANQMEYFISPDSGSREVFRKVSSPEEITIIDPACGSGHFLCYAFDLLAKMYEERGYRNRDIARLVLERNLTGVEIDRRAASLTSFALTMKACDLDARFLRRGVAPKVIWIESIDLTSEERELIGAGAEQGELTDVLSHLGEVGSLWHPSKQDVSTIVAWKSKTEAGKTLLEVAAGVRISKIQEYVDTLSSAYVLCITNPPYMGSNKFAPWTSSWLKKNYLDERADLCTCFISRAKQFVEYRGYNAMLTASSWMFIGTFEKMRHRIIETSTLVAMTQLSTHGFPNVTVPTCMFVQLNDLQPLEGVYIRLEDYDRPQWQQPRTLEAIQNPECGWRYSADVETFKAIPGWPIAYWVNDGFIEALTYGTPLHKYSRPRAGLSTADNERFLRIWWEVSSKLIGFGFDGSESLKELSYSCKWFPHTKGGSYRKWYGNNSFVLNYAEDGAELKHWLVNNPKDPTTTSASRYIRNSERYGQSGFSFSDVSTGSPSFRFQPTGFIPNARGPFIYSQEMSLLALLNSSVVEEYLRVFAPTLTFNVGDLAKVPVIMESDRGSIDQIANQCISLARADYDSFETSWDFSLHPLIRGNRISSAFGLWSAECKERFDALKSNEERLNAIFARIYHMEGEVPMEVEDDKVSVRRAELGRDVRSLISYAVGCMFGRYSLDKPGLVLANQGDGLHEYLIQVSNPRYMPDDDGILPITDDEYFEDDIVAMFCEFLKAAYGPETLEENLQFVADTLGGVGSARKVIRDYFMNQFFADHCATYSVVNAGKRPIYWLIDSGKLGGFRALIYMHRYTPDLLARVRTDYVHERQERYRSRVAELERERESASRREQTIIDKELKRLRAQLDEVTKFEERLHHLSDQMIEIDLDDGFKVNYAKFADVMAKVK